MKDYSDIIDTPVITEKSALKMQNDNVYTFKSCFFNSGVAKTNLFSLAYILLS